MTRTVVVSGGGTGIGKAVAARFASGGDRVVVIGRRSGVLERAAEEVGGTALPADLGDPAELDRILARNADRAAEIAGETLAKVYDRIGFLPRRG